MKYQRTLLLIALFAAGQVAAQELLINGAAATKVTTGEHTIQWLAPAPTVDLNNHWRGAEGLSPRAWTTTVGWHPGVSAFPDEKTYSWQMPLLSIGQKPWPHATSPADGP